MSFSQNVQMIELKSVNISQSYHEIYSGSFCGPRYTSHQTA